MIDDGKSQNDDHISPISRDLNFSIYFSEINTYFFQLASTFFQRNFVNSNFPFSNDNMWTVQRFPPSNYIVFLKQQHHTVIKHVCCQHCLLVSTILANSILKMLYSPSQQLQNLQKTVLASEAWSPWMEYCWALSWAVMVVHPFYERAHVSQIQLTLLI